MDPAITTVPLAGAVAYLYGGTGQGLVLVDSPGTYASALLMLRKSRWFPSVPAGVNGDVAGEDAEGRQAHWVSKFGVIPPPEQRLTEVRDALADVAGLVWQCS
ncbi:hypothetical protein AAEX60_11240 [Luteococcus sp. H101]